MMHIFLHYNGKWNENMEYVDFKVKGMILPTHFSYWMFIEKIQHELKLDNETTTVNISYQVKAGYPPINIEEDSDLQFYMEMKKKETDCTMYPICVNLQYITQRNALVESTVRSEELQNRIMNIEDDEGDVMGFIGYANIMSDAIIERHAENDKENDKQKENCQRIVISNTRQAEIECGQLYKDKKLLKEATSLYAIKNNFQFKVTKSCSRRYNLVCLDSSCNWYLRASKYGRTNMFIIRKFNNNHSCPFEARMGDNRQATSSIIGELIRTKFSNIKTSYTPADIMRDMKVNDIS